MADAIGSGPGDTDGERLPWLQSADPDPEPAPPVWRTVLFVLVGLLAVAAIAFAFLRHRDAPMVSGSGDLIEAPTGPIKTRPEGRDGMKVQGEGDLALATSEGAAANASVNLNAVPEAPVAGQVAGPVRSGASPAAAKVEASVPAATTRLEARAPARAAPVTAAAGSGGSVVQLGSFPSEAGANAAWNQLSRRFGYLAPLGKSVQPAEVKGKTVYRLRVNTGSANQASELCGKLKLAGEACFIAS